MKTAKLILALLAIAGATAPWTNAADSLSADGKTLTLSAAAGETLSYTAALPTTVETIVKTGAGRYDLAPSSSSFAGTVDVRAGTLGADETKVPDTAKWIVANGASLQITALTGDGWSTRPTGALEIGGMGVNGGGAFQLASSAGIRQVMFKGGTTLTSDTLVVGGNVLGFGNIDMGGHNLYVQTPSGKHFNMLEYPIANPGDIHVLSGKIQFGASAKNPYPDMSGGMKYVVLSNGTTMSVSALPASRPVTFGLKIPSGTATLHAGESTSTSLTRDDSAVTGPIEVAGNLTAYTRNHTSGGKTYRRAINLFGPVSVAGRFLHDATGILTFHDSQPHVFNGEFKTQWGGITTFTNTTSNTFGSSVVIGAGRTEFVQSGPNARTEFRGKVTVTANNGANGATLAFEDAGDVLALAAENVVEGTNGLAAPCLSVSGNTVFSVPAQPSFTGNAAATNKLAIGKTAGRHGILAIGPGGVVSNDVAVGGSGAGAIHMTGGHLYTSFGTGNDGSIGTTYGFIGITNGTFETKGHMRLGDWGGRGLLVQKGGLVKSTVAPLKIGRSGPKGMGSCYVAGGTLDVGSDIQLLNQSNPEAGSQAYLTVDGEEALVQANEVCAMPTTGSGDATEIVNLNHGGVVAANRIRRYYQTDATAFYLNFDGGVFRARASVNAFLSSTFMPTRVTAYAGGAVVDTQGHDVTWPAPIVRPEGGGIASIDLPAGIADVPSVGPGAVRIASSGGGTGASAVMDYDMESRQPTRIIVTSPGCGYEAGTTTVTVEDSTRNTYSATFTVTDNATTGGLTKRGSGTLTLTGANTYGGATRVEGGSIIFSNAVNNVSGYPGGDFEVPAAAIQGVLDAPLLQAQSLTFSAGHGVRLTEADTIDTRSFGRTRTIATFETPLASLPSLTVVDTDGTVRPDTGAWRLSLANGGRSLRLGVQYAMTIIVR